jgi:hypothetical protein
MLDTTHKRLITRAYSNRGVEDGLGLAGVEVVQDDVDRALGIGGDHLVHEVEELDPPAALVMAGRD